MRATGRRLTFAQIPPALRDWVGPVTVVAEHSGGMSPGCATTVRTEDGRLLFVKAVGDSLNPQTVELFRYETRVLEALPPVPYRPRLLDSYDRDGWAALLLSHVDGRHPDLTGPDYAAVAAVVHAQVAELTPPPVTDGVTTLAETARRWAARTAEVVDLLPDRDFPARASRLPGRLPAETLCHFDVRDDNLLIGADGTVTVLDWGMTRLGPQWTDRLLLALQRDTATAAALVRTLPPAATDFVAAFAASQTWNAQQPHRPGLPNFAAYCAEDAARLLAVLELVS